VVDTAMDQFKAERQRQIESEGWSAEHDDAHDAGELMDAGMCYFLHATGRATYRKDTGYPVSWPWDCLWWKPTTPTRDLVKAGALFLAEKDRLARSGRHSGHVDHKLQFAAEALDRLLRPQPSEDAANN
jgi:hypothetical protein